MTRDQTNWWQKALSEFQNIIEYRFKNIHLLEEALTHSSYAHESGLPYCNERMEFLGDAVLEICVSKIIYENYPSYDEGRLTRTRASLVCKSAVADWATDLYISDLIRLGKGLSKERNKNPASNTVKSLCADCMEAILGAVFLDGGYSCVFPIIKSYIGSLEGILDRGILVDPKSKLQVITQNMGLGQPSYVLEKMNGEDHLPSFEVVVRVGSNIIGKGFGPSRKAAEFQAALVGIKHLA